MLLQKVSLLTLCMHFVSDHLNISLPTKQQKKIWILSKIEIESRWLQFVNKIDWLSLFISLKKINANDYKKKYIYIYTIIKFVHCITDVKEISISHIILLAQPQIPKKIFWIKIINIRGCLVVRSMMSWKGVNMVNFL